MKVQVSMTYLLTLICSAVALELLAIQCNECHCYEHCIVPHNSLKEERHTHMMLLQTHENLWRLLLQLKRICPPEPCRNFLLLKSRGDICFCTGC